MFGEVREERGEELGVGVFRILLVGSGVGPSNLSKICVGIMMQSG